MILQRTFNMLTEIYVQITDADDMHKDEFYSQINRKCNLVVDYNTKSEIVRGEYNWTEWSKN